MAWTEARRKQAAETMRRVRAQYKAKADEAIRRKYADPEFQEWFAARMRERNANPAYRLKFLQSITRSEYAGSFPLKLQFTTLSCLKCRRGFRSRSSKKNRICRACKRTKGWRYGFLDGRFHSALSA